MTIVELSCIVCGEEIPEDIDLAFDNILYEEYEYICFHCMERAVDSLFDQPRVLH